MVALGAKPPQFLVPTKTADFGVSASTRQTREKNAAILAVISKPQPNSENVGKMPTFSQLPKNYYSTIYADPPWTFVTYSDRGKGRSAENHYSCMTLDQIRQLPVQDIAAKDCALFLWTTDPLLKRAIGIIAAWGFTFKTVAFYWVKTYKNSKVVPEPDTLREDQAPAGLGFWTRANPEICLLATRGRPQRLSASVRKLVVDRRRDHSRKPDLIYGRIEQLVAGPRIELFARQRVEGWDAWGDEVDFFVAESIPKFPTSPPVQL